MRSITPGRKMAPQSVVFERSYGWTESAARLWLRVHGFMWNSKVDAQPRFLRFRQSEPVPWCRYVTRKLRHYPGVRLILPVGCLGG